MAGYPYMKESWRVVSGYPDYAVSNMGRVKRLTPYRSTRVGKILKPNSATYPSVCLYHRNPYARVCRQVHILVATAFVPNPRDLPEVNHKDLDKTNFRASNLEWVTRKGNAEHAAAHGRWHGFRTKAKHVYKHNHKWQVVLAGVYRGTFKTRASAIQFIRQETKTWPRL